MATYTKISELDAATALAGTETLEVVQSGANVKVTPAQIKTYVDGTGITATSVITGEYIFTEDNELDYSASFTDGMSAATVTFTQLPATTVAIQAYVQLGDTETNPKLSWKRTSGGTQGFAIQAIFADVGTNFLEGTYWLPTDNNTLYVTSVVADTLMGFFIIGYKTGA